jgi:DNA-binding response OmpR family regulator
MSSTASEARDTAAGRLGGARADFVASLGRKVSDARELLNALEDDPSSRVARDELRRRLHALGSGARLLRFEAMARSLQEVLGVLDRGGTSGGLRDQDVTFLAQVLDDLPALAWGEPAPRDAAPNVVTEESEAPPGLPPISVLVIGDEGLADALTAEGVVHARAFECERTDDAQAALQIARAYAPDLVLVDADTDQSTGLVEALLDDPLTEPVPVVVVGTFRAPEEAARFVALGVARTLTRPVGPDVIRHACDEVLAALEDHTVRVTLGEPTLEQLADRLSQEFRGALVDGLDPTARAWRVPLGEGTEVLGALWGAIARVQEIVSQKTKGAIRFGGDAPEGAIALAPWLHQEVAGADRVAGRGRGAAAEVRLNGRRVVVADDDPGVTWFIADLLRTAGCDVHEALDGTTALNLAFRVQPELVVSDILMPGLDGFALCRALRRDVALRDTPVMLLSWKEDLLQRVRELGVSAAAYMRKESDSRAVLARVREVLRPRARIEMRLRGDGEVRGRLDDLTPRLLLELVGAIRKHARVAVRDASFLYEIDIRDGAPRRATRTASDGSFQSGERALAMLLAVGAGRFTVAPVAESIRGELTGTLFEQLARPVAAARGALAATTGARTMEVERLVLDADVLEEYLRATPEPARGVLKQLAEGASPRQLLLDGATAPSLMEDLLCDLAGRCAIRAVEGARGVDLLTPAVEAALAILKGALPPRRSGPPNARPSVAVRPAAVLPARAPEAAAAPQEPVPARPRAVPASAQPAPATQSSPATPTGPAPKSTPAASSWSEPPTAPAWTGSSTAASWGSPASSWTAPARPSPRPPAPTMPSNPPPGPAPSQRTLADDDGPPSSLEDAVMREISDRSPEPGAVLGGMDLPPIVEPSELRPRSSNPPANREEPTEPADELPLPSIPPDAIVPGASSNEEMIVAAPVPGTFGEVSATEPAEPKPPRVASERRLVAREPAPGLLLVLEPAPVVEPNEPPPEPNEPPPATPAIASLPPEDLHEVVESDAPSAAPASIGEPAGAAKSRPWAFFLAFALLAGAVVAVLRMASGEAEAPKSGGGGAITVAPIPTQGGAATAASGPTANGPAANGATANAPSANTPMAIAPSATGPGSAGAASAAPSSPAAASDDLPPGAVVPPGYGMLEIAAAPNARVRVDGNDAGKGPLSSSVLRAGYHQVRVDLDGHDSQYVIEVRAGKTTRVKSSTLP